MELELIVLISVIAFLLGLLVGKNTRNSGDVLPPESAEKIMGIVRWYLSRKIGSFPPYDPDHKTSDVEDLLDKLEKFHSQIKSTGKQPDLK